MLDNFLETDLFSWGKDEKNRNLNEILTLMTQHHYDHCPEYHRILDGMRFDPRTEYDYTEIPFIPVRLFKDYRLKSVPDSEIIKTMTSSGTTGQQVSKIYLDRETASLQQKTLVKIVSSFTGSARMPMIIIDSPSVIKDRREFSARGAGILGFSIFGRDRIYALKDDMSLDADGLQKFLDDHKEEKIFLFGFTFMIWQYFYKELQKNSIFIDLSNAVMIHGGGWKKLTSESVSMSEFNRSLKEVCSLSDIHNYYGMVEQTGTVYMECRCGHLHTSNFSDVIIRNPEDWSIQPDGEKGVIETVSVLPHSYPGHVLLTEDEGVIEGEDDCPCGRRGKYFRVLGRIKNAEIRGCSDTYADKISRT